LGIHFLLASRIEFDFRRGPVPYTRKWRGSARFFRQIRYVNALRQATQFVEDEEPRIRAKRNQRLLPNAWDDISDGSRGQRNWKRFRKTQWK